MRKALSFQLYAGLAFAIILVVVVGFVSITSVEKQNDEVEWETHAYNVIVKLEDIRYDLLLMRGSRKNYWLSENDNALSAYSKGKAILPTSINDLKKFVQDDAEQVANISKLESIIGDLFLFWEHKGSINLNDDKAKFKSIIESEDSILSKAYVLIDVLKNKEQSLLKVREGKVQKYVTQTRVSITVGIIFLLIVVILLVNSIISTLKSRYRAGLKLQQHLDEMEKLNQDAKDKNWLLEGVSYINNHIQTTESVSILTNNIIKSLTQYLKLPAGVVYIPDEKNEYLNMTAGFAVSAHAKQSFKIGEGIVGTAATHKTFTITKDISPDYWVLESGLGKTSGKGEILNMPIWLRNDLKAVIELGNFDVFSPQQKLLIKTVSNNIAISINSCQAKEKNTILLAEVQQQKEALVAGQEELRQSNEELNRQTEELQASEEELKTQEEELRQINAELQTRNDAVENARQALTMQAKELQATSKYKSEFLANMSHELRTPLNSVLILAKLLADNNTNNLSSKQIEYANIIHKSGADLLDLINDILDLSKIEAGKIELNMEEIRVESIAADLEQVFSVLAAEKGIQFKVQKSDDTPSKILTDKQRVDQVLKNLLSNAFKFTKKAGNVTLSFSTRKKFDDEYLSISVTDTGIGIPEAKQKLIFEAFQQADGSTSRKYGGTGLGLSISRELMRLLNGEIEAYSEEGKGSTFTIMLPLKITVVKRQPEEFAMPQQKTNDAPLLLNVQEQILVTDDRNDLNLGDKVMLVIEDDKNFATIVRDFAQSKGYKTIVALQGDEGLYYAKKYNPSAITLDIQLPIIDGWSLLKIFKDDEVLKHIPVHIISAFDDSRLHTGGALAYLKKPVDREGLEKAFALIGTHVQAKIKKVLIISPSQLNSESLEKLFVEKHSDATFEQVNSVEEAIKKMQSVKYDCIINDIGVDVKAGIEAVTRFGEQLKGTDIPMIIYLDTDISSADEMQLKKVSDVIVRSSIAAGGRLIDELELFLYKVNEGKKTIIERPTMSAGLDISLANKKILLVDDDMRNVFALSTALESQQMNVITAADGKEALDRLKEDKDIDIVLMDIMMPEMDGYEAMQHIRKDLLLTRLPVIALTAKAMQGDREKCIQAGASDYITKPVDIQKLFSLIRVWLAQ